MPDCTACNRIYRADCKDTCAEFQAELAKFRQQTENHVHDLYMRIMYPYARGA